MKMEGNSDKKNKKRILILVDWFAPGYKAGGPIQSCVNISFALKDAYEIYVYTTDTDFGSNLPYAEIVADQWIQNLDPGINVFYASKKNISRQQLKGIIKDIAPDFVYLNHLFSPFFVVYPLFLMWTGFLKAKVVLCPRGALYESALAIKPVKKYIFLKVLQLIRIQKHFLFHATNEREMEAILKHFPQSEVRIANNLPKANLEPFVAINKEGGSLKMVFISRIHPIKNLHFLLGLLNLVRSRILLTIIGPVEDSHYWESCQKLIQTLPGNIEVNYKGPAPNYELLNLIRQNHLFVLPTTGENFGHAIFDAFLAGRPILISDQTPWIGLAEKELGWDLPLSNSNGFVEAIETAAHWNQDEFLKYALASWNFAGAYLSDPLLINQYFQIFDEKKTSK